MNGQKDRRSSVLWNYFTIFKQGVAICNICQTKISYRSSTSNLKKHINNRHPNITVPGLSYKLSQNKAKQRELTEVDENNIEVEILPQNDLMDVADIDLIVGNDNTIESSVKNDDSFEESDDHMVKVNTSAPRINNIFSQNRKNLFQQYKGSDHQYQKDVNSLPQNLLTNKDDSYDCFGKYIASLLREIGQPASLSLQEEINSLVLRKLCYLNA